MLHPENIFLAERISRVIEEIWQKTQPKDNGGVILEVNAAPGFRMHLARLKVCPEMSQLL
jgi:cyanophycin synthetase